LSVAAAGTNGFTQERVSILFHVPNAGRLYRFIPSIERKMPSSKMEFRTVRPSISTVSSDSFLKSAKNEVHKNKPITVTRCLSSRCTGLYTDSLSESILIRCVDPKHSNGEDGCSGAQPQATNQTHNHTSTLQSDGASPCQYLATTY
jgi:hypothetical protein